MIEVTASATSNTDFEKEVDADLNEFSEWVHKRLGQPVVNSERSILKTYLWYKVKERNAPAVETSPVEASNGT
jgi:hypothetical protein